MWRRKVGVVKRMGGVWRSVRWVERESGCGRCGKRKWVWLGGRCREESGCGREENGGGYGEGNGRCV